MGRVSTDADHIQDALISNRFRVNLGHRLPEMDSPGAIAFAASDLVRPEQPVFALVQRAGMPRREHVVKKLLSEREGKILCPLGDGVVSLTGVDGSGQRLATILDFPAGGKLFPRGVSSPMTERELRSRIIPQVLQALTALHERTVTHRGICLENLYLLDHAGEQIVLGECFSSPPGYILPPACEPLDSAQANPEGRGEGTTAHDMFAFGVLVMSLFLGREVSAIQRNPLSDDFDKVMLARIRQGSVLGLGGGGDVTGAIAELLRGLLDDRSDKRWGVEDVRQWLGGITARVTADDERWALVRPIAFEDKVVHDRRHLAFALSRNVSAAATLVRNGKFLHWVQNTLVEALEPEWLEKMLDTRPPSSVGAASDLADEWAVTRICAVLDPNGPIRFKGMVVTIDGLPHMLAMAVADDDTEMLSRLRDLMAGERFRQLLQILFDRNSLLATHYKRLVDCSKYIDSQALGFGFERVLYTLNPNVPCRSPHLKECYVDTLTRLMKALEERARKGGLSGRIVDPHIAAFIAHHRADTETLIKNIEAGQAYPERFAVAALTLFGRIQHGYHAVELPGLAGLLSDPIKRSIGELHSRSYRSHLLARIEKLVAQGDLGKIAEEINVQRLRQLDDRNFRAAQHQILLIERERRRLESPISPQDPEARRMGAAASVFFSISILAATAVYLMIEKGV